MPHAAPKLLSESSMHLNILHTYWSYAVYMKVCICLPPCLAGTQYTLVVYASIILVIRPV